MDFLDIKQKTKSVFQLVKTLDEQKGNFKSISDLFAEDLNVIRQDLVALIESILLEDFENVGRKTRDILWRKVYYDPISISKKFWKLSADNLKENEIFQLINFIKFAIKHYKTLILKFEEMFGLEIRYIIDFSIIANGADAFEKKNEKVIYTVNEMSHAVESIHAFLVCLGDLHRYCIEFNFAEKDFSINTSKDLAAKYYVEAFKLNPKIGMPHNQLGTLCAGVNFELDSIFHYLYSLCSPLPFELSEANVNRIFQQNVEALEKMEEVGDGFNTKNFIMQMILVIDIFFYDKDVEEFNTICRSVLVSFKEYLNSNRRNHQKDLTFQLTSIFMLCLLKLKLKSSPKVHSLNAFLVAFCSEIVKVSIDKIDDFIADNKDENLQFHEAYNKRFNEFDRKIKTARDNNRVVEGRKQKAGSFKDSGSENNGSVNNSQKNGHSSNQLSLESKQLSGEASGKSDPRPVTIAKKPQPSSHGNNNRRRRKRCKNVNSMSSSDESDTESIRSEFDRSDVESMNSDFDSYDEQDDFSDRYSSEDEQDSDDDDDDGDDVVIENEEIVFANVDDACSGSKKKNVDSYAFPREQEDNQDDVIIEDEQVVFADADDDNEEEGEGKTIKLKFKKKYSKISPTIIIRFNELNDGWMKSLKILFDWLRLNADVLVECYRSNPEFIKRIMKLVNFLNIDIFTRKIYFDRSMLTTKNVREGLRHLFDIRHTIPTFEDIVFKKNVMFDELQRVLDWDVTYKLQITNEEDVILRNFKIIDFGFHLCKMKKFSYNFCARTRVFIEKTGRRRNRGQRNNGDERKRGGRRERRRNRRRNKKDSDCDRFERLAIRKHSKEVEEYPSIEQSHQSNFRKGYLKNKAIEGNDNSKQIDKNELMGKLWLKSEIQTLESKKHSAVALTPYIMLDSKCLTDYLNIVKNLVKSKKFIVLIPKAVLSDLDDLKKSKEGARDAIKWLEAEFKKGNRFMRAQREPESLLPLVKIPSKLDIETSIFVKIVNFANFIVSNNSPEEESEFPVLTLLTGDNLDDQKKNQQLSATVNNHPLNKIGILQSIPVKYEQIVRFYSKSKKK
ncbi:CLUMA_CG014443, isoform A [Clunio marinus]|uniref:CLUMA_CG014443, isoform A n=1 Tax=Clunio marinus TaxID=568069 RepID=A0A1J1IMT2_9DIPT|nr:CLUMA_CG014443, isoform A [Clunio marinus]